MQVALSAEPHFVCAALLVVSEVLKARADVKLSQTLFEQESEDEAEEEAAGVEAPTVSKKQLPRKKRKKLAQKEEAERQKA